MAKYFDKIGFASMIESEPGLWKEEIVERGYYIEVIDMSHRLQSSDRVNDNISVSDKLSIMADPYATENIQNMRYVVYMGVKWKIAHVGGQRPRLILTLGGLYND